jgi:hypothetical protein
VVFNGRVDVYLVVSNSDAVTRNYDAFSKVDTDNIIVHLYVSACMSPFKFL